MIKSYQKFLEASSYEDEVAAICKRYNIRYWSINPDTGLVDVDGHVNLNKNDLTKLPLNFGKVFGEFQCYDNRLETLEGSPYEVGNFYCFSNQLTSLEFAPKKVSGIFSCGYNKLESLEGCPSETGDFWCKSNLLTSLEIFPSVSGNFYAEFNPISNLTDIGLTMIKNKISFLEAVSIHIKEIPDTEIGLIFQDISAQKILDLNDFRVFNVLRTHLPKKYADVMKLSDIDLSADLGELGF